MAQETTGETATKPDSGTSTYDVHVVRGGVDDRGLRYYDTVGSIAQAWRQANPQSRMTQKQVENWIVRRNNLRDARGRDCDNQAFTSPVIYADQRLIIPEGNELNEFDWKYKCPPPPRVTPNPEVAAPIVQAPPPAQVITRDIPLAQFIPANGGAYDYGAGVNDADFFMGRPPRDPAAMGHQRRGRRDGDALTPPDSEGTHTRVDTRAERARTNGVDGIDASRSASDNFELYRTQSRGPIRGELEYGPSATVRYNRDGSLVGPNPRFGQKFEQNSRLVIDAEGDLVSVVDGSALISFDRRQNPYHGNIWRDAMTARNLISQWNNTGEGQRVIAAYAGIDRAYTNIGNVFFGNEAAPSAVDAERLLQLNTQLALHPLIWSASSQGVPVGNTDVIRGEMQRVFDSPRFAQLPQADQDRLRSTYTPYMAQLDNPNGLDAAINANGGRGQWYNPMTDWAHERSQERFIQRGYWDGIARDDAPRRPTAEQRQRLTEETGEVIANRVWSSAIRPPSQTEYALGTGLLQDTTRQSTASMSQSRIALLQQMEADPALRAQVIQHVLNTPGAMDNWANMLNYSTRGRTTNGQLLGYRNDREADRGVENLAAALGGEEFRERVDFDGGNIVTNTLGGFGRLFTLGAKRPGINRNQNRGLDGFQQATAARYAQGGEAAAQVDGAFLEIIRRSREAEQRGLPVAASAIVQSLDPNRVEDLNRGQLTPQYQALLAAAGPRGAQTIYDQMVVNIDRIGNVNAGVEASVERRVAQGQVIEQVDAATAQAAIEAARTGQRVETRTAAVAGPDGVMPAADEIRTRYVVNYNAPTAAQVATPEMLAARLAVANSPNLASQGSVDRNVVTSAASASPALFSMMTVGLLADPGTNPTIRENAQAAVNTIDRGKEQHSRYADLIDRHVRAIRAANDNPATLAAAQTEALTAFNNFFADAERSNERLAAVSQLSGYLAADAQIAGAFNDRYAAQSTDQRAAALVSLVQQGKITEQDRLALLSLEANSDPAARMAGFESWLARHNETNHTLTAGIGLSYVDILTVAMFFIPGGKPPEDPSLIPGDPVNCQGVCRPTIGDIVVPGR